MPTKPKPVRLKLSPGVPALRYAQPKGARLAGAPRVVLAHGAGAGQSHPFMVAFAEGLAARGLEVTTFDFPYVARGKKSPDPPAVLEECTRAAVAETGEGPVALGGKSMGGRIASQVVAAGGEAVASVRGLFFLGYPLHAPGKADQPRVEHFPRLRVPCLFVQGTRDAFGGPGELAPRLRRIKGKTKVVPVEGGDHSFTVPKRGAAPQDAVYARIYDEVAAFVRGLGR